MLLRRHPILLGLLVPCLVTCLSLPAAAQTGAQVAVTRFELARFPTTALELAVRDERGRLVTKLSQGQFTILEDTKRNDNLEKFEELSGNAVPATIGIVFDAATSLSAYIGAGRQATETFINQTGASVVGTNEMLSLFIPIATPDQELQPAAFVDFIDATKRNDLINALREIVLRSGTTSLYQTINEAIRATEAKARERGSKAVVLVVSDGVDRTVGEETYNLMLKDAQASGVAVIAFALGTGDSLDAPDRGQRLRALADATKGRYIQVLDDQAVKEVYQAIVQAQPTSSYRLTYRSLLVRDTENHRVEIKVRLSGTQEITSVAEVFTVPTSEVALRPLASLLQHYFSITLPVAVLISVITVLVVRTARRITSRLLENTNTRTKTKNRR